MCLNVASQNLLSKTPKEPEVRISDIPPESRTLVHPDTNLQGVYEQWPFLYSVAAVGCRSAS